MPAPLPHSTPIPSPCHKEPVTKELSTQKSDAPLSCDTSLSCDESLTPLILLVDDDPDLRSMLCMFLKLRCHCMIVAARSGQHALTVVEELIARGQKPDLILLDWVLPDLCGYEVARRMRQASALKETPVIVVSEHCWHWQMRQQAQVVGCQECVDKAELLSKLPTLVAYYTAK